MFFIEAWMVLVMVKSNGKKESKTSGKSLPSYTQRGKTIGEGYEVHRARSTFSLLMSTVSKHLSCSSQRARKHSRNDPIRSSMFFPNMTQKALQTHTRNLTLLCSHRTDQNASTSDSCSSTCTSTKKEGLPEIPPILTFQTQHTHFTKCKKITLKLLIKSTHTLVSVNNLISKRSLMNSGLFHIGSICCCCSP